MKRWTLRLGLSWMLLVVLCPGRLPGQDTAPRGNECCTGDGFWFWARAEYLLWWVKGAPLPVPLVTTGDPTVGFPSVNTAGAIGQNGTQVLLGNSTQRFGAFSGTRLSVGGWFDPERGVGFEASGFFLGRGSDHFAAASDSAGNPPLYFPRVNAATGGEGGVPIADPLRGFSGAVAVDSTLELWGAELNGCVTMLRGPGVDVSLLGGFRSLNLKETLHIHNTTTDLLVNNTTSLNDHFDTRNQFYGGQVGCRLSWQAERLSLDLTGKVAFGVTHQLVSIQGDVTQLGPNPVVPPGLGTFPGGLFAQPSNIGRRTADPFTVLPAAELKLGYQFTSWLRAFVGYDFLYSNQVVRPGPQIDRGVNLTQNAVLDPNGAGQLVGPARPAPLLGRTDFWAHGISLGLQLCY